MPDPAEPAPTIFTTVKVAPDDPILRRPPSPLTVDAHVTAARLVSAFPGHATLMAFAPAIVTFRLTAEEFAAIQTIAAEAAGRN